MTELEIAQFGKGAFPDPIDERDVDAVPLMASVDLPRKFSLRSSIKIKNQKQTLSCVGHAGSYYAEALNNKEEGALTQLSARDLYSRIYVPPTGGAWLRDAMKAIVDQGIVLEADAPSIPTSEAAFRKRDDITPEEVERGKRYQAKAYGLLPANSYELWKQAIFQNWGVLTGATMSNAGWVNAHVRPPLFGEPLVGHGVWACGWDDDIQKIEFANSFGEFWGEGGFGWIGQDYFNSGLLFNPWTLVDKPNTDIPTPPPYQFTRDLYFGIKGPDVKELQKYLNRTGFKVAVSGAGSPGFETENYGWLTRAAVARWQAFYGVYPPAGYFGPKSRAKYKTLIPQ